MTFNYKALEVSRALHNLRVLGWTVDIEERGILYVAHVQKGQISGITIPMETVEDAAEAAVRVIMKL